MLVSRRLVLIVAFAATLALATYAFTASSRRGDGGTDVCIGGPGTDTFNASCETQIQ